MVNENRDGENAQGDVNVIAFLESIAANWLLVLTAVVLCLAIAVVLALTATPKFRAEVVVAEVHDDGLMNGKGLAGQLGGLASLAGMNLGGIGTGEKNAEAVLESRHLIEELVRRENLLPQLFPKTEKPPTLWLGVKMFQDKLVDIHEDKLKGTTTVAVEWTDPVAAAKWANELVALANEIIRKKALDESAANIAYLNAEVAHTNEVELQRVLFNLIESQTKVQMLAKARLEYALATVDPAVAPEIRFSPRRTLMVLGGLAIGLVIGAALAVLRDMWKGRGTAPARPR